MFQLNDILVGTQESGFVRVEYQSKTIIRARVLSSDHQTGLPGHPTCACVGIDPHNMYCEDLGCYFTQWETPSSSLNTYGYQPMVVDTRTAVGSCC